MYKYLLFDLDNTLLDFTKAEARALKSTFEKFDIPYNEINVSLFRKYNLKYWSLFEEGKISKERLLVKIFEDFFASIDIDKVNPDEFNTYYLDQLTNGSEEIDYAYYLLEHIKNYDISIITNGVSLTQRKRISKSRLNKYFNHLYISDEIGYQKPKVEFFDYVFKDLNIKDKKEVLLIGDSLTSDISGGIQYGIDTVWFNPKKTDSLVKPTYVINNLKELLNILS